MIHNCHFIMPFSLFSSVSISERLDAFRVAEQHLFDFAKTRFAPHQEKEASHHHFDLFDTPIEVPSVIRKEKGAAAASCQVHASEAVDEGYRLHGVRVTNEKMGREGARSGPTSTGEAPLVLLHGYANGALYFYRNLMGLSRHFRKVYALDMLGWGLSSRPTFDLLTSDKDLGTNTGTDDNLPIKTKQKVYSAESFFVESLESWRRHHNISKMTLAGHSMGGYLSVAYTERYPQHVERLILLSPVGVPEQQPEDEAKIKSFPLHIRAMFKTVRYLFNRGITPGCFLRSLPYSKSKVGPNFLNYLH